MVGPLTLGASDGAGYDVTEAVMGDLKAQFAANPGKTNEQYTVLITAEPYNSLLNASSNESRTSSGNTTISVAKRAKPTVTLTTDPLQGIDRTTTASWTGISGTTPADYRLSVKLGENTVAGVDYVIESDGSDPPKYTCDVTDALKNAGEYQVSVVALAIRTA